MTKVNEFEAKIKADIAEALNALKDVDSKDQLLTFLQSDIDEFFADLVESEYDEEEAGEDE